VPPIRYVGPKAQYDTTTGNTKDLSDIGYLNWLISKNMLMAAAQSRVTTDLAPYAAKSYADTAMSGLATSSWLLSQIGNYIHHSSISAADGPVGLSASGLVPKGLINAASTQEWPLPYYSPSTYNSGNVAATTVENEIYSATTVTDPGFPYTLMVFGQVDTLSQADGVAAKSNIRVGTTTGRIIATGVGVFEDYVGPVPGDTYSLISYVGNQTQTNGAWGTFVGWVPDNSPPFFTVMEGGYLQAQQTMDSATLFAAASYSGIHAGFEGFPQSYIRIIDNLGNVYAQSNAGWNNSGSVTIPWTGPITAGQLFAVQGLVNGLSAGLFGFDKGKPGKWSPGAYLEIIPPQVSMLSMAPISPTPAAFSTPLTGDTTVHTMVASSNSASEVVALTTAPGLWILPIPWHA